jgi:hypothetical protein
MPPLEMKPAGHSCETYSPNNKDCPTRPWNNKRWREPRVQRAFTVIRRGCPGQCCIVLALTVIIFNFFVIFIICCYTFL